jgi:hypothetical protein
VPARVAPNVSPAAANLFDRPNRHPLVRASAAASFLRRLAVAMLTEITNKAIGLTGGEPQSILNNYFFSANLADLLVHRGHTDH